MLILILLGLLCKQDESIDEMSKFEPLEFHVIDFIANDMCFPLKRI